MGDVFQWVMIPLLLLMVLYINTSAVAETTISMKAPINPVRLDAMLSLYCKVQDLDEGTHAIVISKEDQGGQNYKQLSSGDKVQVDDARIFLAVRRLSEYKVFFLSIINVERGDEGIYKCKLIQNNPTSEIEAHPVKVNITYMPEQNPECSSSEPLKNMMAGDTLNWNCSSEEGFPKVTLTWVRSNTGKVLKSQPLNQTGKVVSQLSYRLTEYDDQTMFVCELTSEAFPDEQTKRCHIGPVHVKPNPLFTSEPYTDSNSAYIGGGGVVDNNKDNTEVGFPTPGSPANNKPECKEYCSTLTTPVFHWIIATISAGVLAIIFLIIGIVISIKLCNLSSTQSSQTGRIMMQQRRYPLTDDTYAELDCKQDEGNRVYMMLDRSHIPEMQPLNPNLDREGNYTRTPTATKEIQLPTHTQCV